ncbi:hypothetical protein IW261DRAFT_1425127 [Armillaria novae-zelandiae]|uniref:Uncharacterized protein n=1 Tax=Armillaria novae-zelandiae TaxID=153914 RepID=A0AA39T8D3_9AGAR|nr:hypothetical protein IW261DRAFT_1425127 [Armillaria novae-zelandiae]
MPKTSGRATAPKRDHSPVVASPAKKARTDDLLNVEDDISADADSKTTSVKNTASNSNNNPYAVIANSIIHLMPVNDYIKSRDIPERVPTVNVATLYRNNYPVIIRLMHIAFAPSKDNLMNICLVDPDNFTIHSERVIRNSLVAQTAAIGHIFGLGVKKVLMNNGFRRGLSFTSWLKSGDFQGSGSTIPVNGRRHGPAIHSRDEPVPVFDCRGPFKLSSYHTCPASTVDPDNGSIILVIFTLNRYRELSYNVASYNVQVVLRLADPPSDNDAEKPATPLPAYLTSMEPIGVRGLVDTENVFAVAEEDDTSERLVIISHDVALSSMVLKTTCLIEFRLSHMQKMSNTRMQLHFMTTTNNHTVSTSEPTWTNPTLFLRAHAEDVALNFDHLPSNPLRVSDSSPAFTDPDGATENSMAVEPRLYWAWPDRSNNSRPSSPHTASRDDRVIVFNEAPAATEYAQEMNSEPATSERNMNIQFDRHLLAVIFRYIACELDSTVPNEHLRQLAVDLAYLLSLKKKADKVQLVKRKFKYNDVIENYSLRILCIMITVSRDNLRLNMRHNCDNITVHPTRPLINGRFLVVASLVVWPKLDPLELAGDDSSEEEDSQVTHLVLRGQSDDFEESYPVELLTAPLPSLHTLQLHSLALRSAGRLEYSLQALQRLSIWNCHVSVQGLFLIVRSAVAMSHFAIGGKDSRVVDDSNNSSDIPTIPPPSFPPTLLFLHLDICELGNQRSSHRDNPYRPRILAWLGNLHGPMCLCIHWFCDDGFDKHFTFSPVWYCATG